MALDSELLDRFERDWNDALANYEARTTAARMGNIQYDPASRTFAPQEPAPGIAAGIREELLGPLQSKWGALAALAGGGRGRAAAATSPTQQKYFNTSAGVVAVDQFGTVRKIFDVPPNLRGAGVTQAERESAAMRRLKLSSDIGLLGRQMTEQRKFLADIEKIPEKKRTEEQKLREQEIRLNLRTLDRRRAGLFATPTATTPGWTPVDPMTIPFGNPVTQAPAVTEGATFFGSPVSSRPPVAIQDNLFDPGPGVPYVDSPEVMSSDYVEELKRELRGRIPLPPFPQAPVVNPRRPFTITGRRGEIVQGLDFSEPSPVPAVQAQPVAPLPVGPSARRGIRVLEIIREGR